MSDTIELLERLSGGTLTLGRLLNAIREGDEMSIEEMSEVIGVAPWHLMAVERGDSTLPVSEARRVARVLGYSEEQFSSLALSSSVNG